MCQKADYNRGGTFCESHRLASYTLWTIMSKCVKSLFSHNAYSLINLNYSPGVGFF